jgi:DNA ligase-1
VRRQVPRDADWRQVKYMVFEQPDGAAPLPTGSKACAHRRRAGVPWLQMVEQFRVADRTACRPASTRWWRAVAKA